MATPIATILGYLVALAPHLAVLSLTFAGLALIAGFRAWAMRLVWLAALLAVVHAIGPAWLTPLAQTAGLGLGALVSGGWHDLSGSLMIWCLVGALGAHILGATRIAWLLALPPAWRWLIAPMIQPLLDQLPLWLVAVVSILFVLALLRGGLVLLVGRDAAGHVFGTWIVRLVDALARAAAWPIRAIRRRRG
jgi:hypothetical protein